MKLTFLGANHVVTGSRTLLTAGGRNTLIDVGMEQGALDYQMAQMPVHASQLDHIIITHAHIDHSGLLPLMVKQGFAGKVYATRETCSLLSIMLRDSAYIQEQEAAYQTRKNLRAGRKEAEPLYTLADAEKAEKLFRPCAYGETTQIDEHLTLCFYDIGHLLGSACARLEIAEDGQTRSMLFSGDVGNINQPIINDPLTPPGADYLLLESTYGNRNHEKKDGDSVTVLARALQRTLDRGGNVVIPSFAVGRTQELLYFIREIKERGLVTGHDGFPVYVDSPLANEATAVFLQCGTDCLDKDARAVMARGENPLWFDGLHTVVSSEESKALNDDKTPKVLIAASGMCDAGRIRHHLKHNLWRQECLILFVGYQSQGTLGRTLYEGAKKVKLFGESVAVNAEIALLPGTSGHADQDGLLRWAGSLSPAPETVFLNHGEDAPMSALSSRIQNELNLPCRAPFSGSCFDLLAGEWLTQTSGVPIVKKVKEPQQTAAHAALSQLSSHLTDALANARKAPEKQQRVWAKKLEQLIAQINSYK